MALREKLQERAHPYLAQGEQARHVFLAQTGPSPYLNLLTYLVSFWAKAWIFVVTDQSILVLQASLWKPAQPRSLAARLPRATRLGPLSGLWGKMELGGTTYYVHKRFHKDVAAADAEIGGGSATPPERVPEAQGAIGTPPSAAQPGVASPQSPAQPQVPAGWHPDPRGEARLRYWDGSAWTEHTSA